MKGDISRNTFNPRKHYSQVLMQQGRVKLDADCNEREAIHQYRLETEARDVIGPCGVPETVGGFEIRVAVPLVSDLNAVFFVNAQTGWAVGADGTILATTNGGQSWRQQMLPATVNPNVNLNDVFFIDPNQGWIVNDEGQILNTTDGGDTWTLQQQVSGISPSLFRVFFVQDAQNQPQGWTVGRISGVAGFIGIILTTIVNGGEQIWEEQVLPSEVSISFVADVFFLDNNQGWALGLFEQPDADRFDTIILATVDGGQTWTVQFFQGAENDVGWLGFVFIRDPNNAQVRGWAVGFDGTIRATSNGGATWEPQLSGVSEDLLSLTFVTPNRGWVVGNNGTILVTSDGGTTWNLQTSGVTENLIGVTFLDQLQGWVVGNNGTILVTNDGGEIWTQPSQLNDLTIAPGRIYVDGILCENEETLFFTQQPSLPGATLPWEIGPTDLSYYLVYLDVWQRHITALEDPLIREVALGGPDTATRQQTVCQVKILPLALTDPAPTCASQLPEWQALTAPSTGTLNARTQPPDSSDNPCLIPPSAGFQRLENQLYRVEIHQAGDLETATFKWSRDNGSVVTTIEQISGNQVTVQDVGPDDIRGFASGQWVEILDDRLELNGQPGQLVQISEVNAASRMIMLITPPAPLDENNPSGVDPSLHPKLRRWDQTGPTATESGVPITTDWVNLEGGIQVQFSTGTYDTGDYWLIPARTATAEIEWPPYQIPNTNPIPQLPLGIQHHFCRLAIVQFGRGPVGPVVSIREDCRPTFPPLTAVKSAIYVTGISWRNDDIRTLEDFRANGLDINLDTAPIQQDGEDGLRTISPATMIVTLESPLILGGGDPPNVIPDFSFILDGNITVVGSQIQWRLAEPQEPGLVPLENLVPLEPDAVLVRVTLKGRCIWTTNGQQIYLDGQAFGAPGLRSDGTTPRTALMLPSGDGARASDFESWFWLTQPIPMTPIQLTSLVLDPTIVDGGDPFGPSNGTVTISEPAPEEGVLISLESDNTEVATVQPTIMVTAGQSSATFQVNTFAVVPVDETRRVTITASLAESELSAELIVRGPIG